MPRNYGTDKHDRPSDAEKVGYEPRVPADWTNVPADVQEALDEQAASGGGGGGETNTASNQGVGGIGVFDNKDGVDLEFRNVIAKSSKIVVTLNASNKEVEVDAVEANIVHDNLSGFVADEHVAHGGVTLTAGSGLNGGGTIASNRTFNMDAAQRTRTHVFYIEDPTATDVFPIMFTKDAITITKIYGIVDAATSVQFSLWHRAFANTFTGTSETEINDDTNDPVVATTSGDSTTDFSPGDATVPAESTISYKASAIVGSPLKLMVVVSYTVD